MNGTGRGNDGRKGTGDLILRMRENVKKEKIG